MSATPWINLSQSCDLTKQTVSVIQEWKNECSNINNKHFEGKIIIHLLSGLAAISKNCKRKSVYKYRAYEIAEIKK